MAKYNAIYEGRLPHGIYSEFIADSDVTSHQGFAGHFLDSINKIYRKCIDVFS